MSRDIAEDLETSLPLPNVIKELLEFSYEGVTVFVIQEDSVHGRRWHTDILDETGRRRICNNFAKGMLAEMFMHTFNHIEALPVIAARNAVLASRN